MNPNDIYARFISKYSECTSYRDAGQVMQYRKVTNDPTSPEMTFRTVFERPSRLRFEWTKSRYPSTNAYYVLVSDGQQTWKHYSFHDEPQICESLQRALGGATGISNFEVRIIPALLTDLVTSKLHPKILGDLRLMEPEAVGNHECYRILASAIDADDTTLWLSMHDFSLRRHSSVMRHHFSETTYTEVEINPAIKDETFRLREDKT